MAHIHPHPPGDERHFKKNDLLYENQEGPGDDGEIAYLVIPPHAR